MCSCSAFILCFPSVYPLRLTIHSMATNGFPSPASHTTFPISRFATFFQLKQEYRPSIAQIPLPFMSDMRLWLEDGSTWSYIEDEKLTLDECHITEKTHFMMEVKQGDRWTKKVHSRTPRINKERKTVMDGKEETSTKTQKYIRSNRSTRGSAGWSVGMDETNGKEERKEEEKRMNTRVRTPGLVGLMNLGNTCFLNSSIQCLAACTELTQYFVNRSHLSDLNEKNPLGTAGQLAKHYATLIHQMHSGVLGPIGPYELKYAISTFAKQFSGYRQHDSHELLSFLLDGLHEVRRQRTLWLSDR